MTHLRLHSLRFLPTLLTFVLATVGCQSQPKSALEVTKVARPATIEEAVANPMRRLEDRRRDVYRHPEATLKFFGIQPEMTVIEISPGNGWYSQILAPLLTDKGQYIAAIVPAENGEHFKKMKDSWSDWMGAHPEVGQRAKSIDFDPPKPLNAEYNNSADAVVTFRNVHNWAKAGAAEQAFKDFYTVLKPGGILGVVEHRASEKMKRDSKANSGYVREKDVVAMARKAGFKLVASSEINANPKDLKKYPEGVWTLPPTLRLKDKDREKYLKIGESDRMTLKFIKPKN